MSRTLITDIVQLTRDGWRPYNAAPEGYVYDRLGCPRRERAYWFVKGDLFVCVGCLTRCSLTRPAGFPCSLPIKYPEPRMPYTLTPHEMVRKKAVLQVKEAAYCLNISERKIYELIACGKLNTLKDKPKRVSAEDVRSMMEDFEL